MTQDLGFLDPHLKFKILEVQRQCERRRRTAAALNAAAWCLLLVLVFTLILWAAGNALWPRTLAVLAFLAALGLIVWRFLYRPARHPISTRQIALYIDENHPELENRVLSLVSLSENSRQEDLTWIIERFLRESQSFVRKSSFSYEYPRDRPDSRALVIGVLVLLSFLMLWRFQAFWGPAFSGLSSGWKPAKVDFIVEPGSTRVRLGEDQVILVRSTRAHSSMVIVWREAGGIWSSEPMRLGDSQLIHYYQFKDIRGDLRYRISAGVGKSPIYRIKTWLPPEVTAVDLVYHYPAYLNMPAREVPNGGDITAIEGSNVDILAIVNQPMGKVSAVLDSGGRISFTKENGSLWKGSLAIKRNDRYEIVLENAHGEAGVYQPHYDITVQGDQPPVVKIDFPRGDREVSALEELSFDFKVVDDFGLQDYGMRYRVAGRDIQWLSLMREEGPALEARGRYELFLEDLKLEPGDLIIWNVYAEDHKPGREEYETLSDPYFLEIRPFKRRFQAAVSNQGGRTGAGGAGEDLITLQKEVLIATWNLRRKASGLERDAFRGQRDTILASQKKVKAGVIQNFAGAANRDPGVGALVEAVSQALAALQEAGWPRPAAALSRAAVQQQRAYQLLLKLAPDQSRVAQMRGRLSSGGAGQRPMAGMEELEMKRNRNFYEREKRAQLQDEAVENALDQIKELARRQGMLNEEMAKLISELERDGADEREIRRRLERLREESQKNLEQLGQIEKELVNVDPQLARQSRDRLDQVRQRLNQGLRSLEERDLQGARGAGSQAISDLNRIGRELEKRALGSAKQRMGDLAQTLRDLQREQEEIRESIAAMGEEKESPRLSEKDAASRSKDALLEKKKAAEEGFQAFMEDAARIANLSRGSQELLARKLGDWLRRTSREGILEEMKESTRLLKFGIFADLAEKEAKIAEMLQRAGESFQEVAAHAVGDELEARDKALAELKRLLERMSVEPGKNGEREMRRFAESGYRDWLEGIRDAESLLSDNSPWASGLIGVRRQIERMRRQFRDDSLVPRFDLFLEAIQNPLVRIAARIDEGIRELKRERRFVYKDDGSIPDYYRDRVSQYFQALSESEGAREP